MNPIKNHKGITLIEVVVASTILVIAMLPLMAIYQSCLHNYQKAGERTQLVGAGKGIIEQVIASRDYTTRELTGLQYEKLSGIEYNLSITSYDNSDSLKKIRLFVYWGNRPETEIYFTTVRLDKYD